MLRTIVLRVVLSVGLFGVLAMLPPGAFLSEAEAGKNAYARKVLRKKEHKLMREARHNQREAAREKRQAGNLKRALKPHRPHTGKKKPTKK